ncbi:MAG: hypothetical protein C4523_08240 [Myxococcales bacterium]|nr:MAG: hypothetical protein C4523_08240 [Myxococcales bacterium]
MAVGALHKSARPLGAQTYSPSQPSSFSQSRPKSGSGKPQTPHSLVPGSSQRAAWPSSVQTRVPQAPHD